MLDRFREHLRTSGLIPEGASVLVGYSGGADSTCLLHLLKEARVEVTAGHLHHGQRPEANKELERCEALCADLGIPFMSGRADVPAMSRDLKIGLEEAGREARYGFLRNGAFRLQCDLIATAHTRSDLIETVLLNVTRGCGLHGLAGIPERRGNIVRPLLIFSRDEARDYCTTHGFWFHDDPANADISFSRARVRHRVLRELRAINPAFDSAVERMVEIVGEEDRFLNGMAAAALEQSEVALNGELRFLTIDCEVAFNRNQVCGLPPVLFKRAMRLAVEALGGALDSSQTKALLAGVIGSEKGAVTAEEGKVSVEWSPTLIHLRQLLTELPFRHPLTVPGETISDESGWVIIALPTPDRTDRTNRTDLTIRLDNDKIRGPLYFRSTQPGDQMQPIGFAGHRKLSALLSDAKLTRAARARLPIICDMVGPLWAPGVCLDARAAAEAGCRNAVQLRFGPAKGPEGHNVGNAT
ncbi:MAG: tRNA lysidine(34) synthetase TilS [Fimbriimonadales bacterium]